MKRTTGLYAIYDRAGLADDALEAVAAALAGGARWLQYRDKRTSAPDRALLDALRALTREYDAALIVNDDWRSAQASGADGVHLGQSDGRVADARAALGAGAIIGVSCSGDIERARRAVADGADYVSFGRFYPSRTKPDAPGAALDVLAAARDLGVPRVAIGGIDRHNAPAVIAAGADLVAVAGGLFQAADVGAAARALTALFPATATSPDRSSDR